MFSLAAPPPLNHEAVELARSKETLYYKTGYTDLSKNDRQTMTTSQVPDRPLDIVEQGESIYECHKQELEQLYRGQYVAINVLNGQLAIGQSSLEAIHEAKKTCGVPFAGYLRGIGFVEFFGNV
jgi:hypothetical protein